MVSILFNCTALLIHFLMIWYILIHYLENLVHCIKFGISIFTELYSWKACENYSFDDYLGFSAFYGLSGYLLVLGNCREFHILYPWLLVTAQLIGLTFAYLGYGKKLLGNSLRNELLLYPGFLVISFLLVLMHLLVAKDIIKNRWIKGFIIGCMSLTVKIEPG